jgi:hypothetical protein
MNDPETRICPFCAETVKRQAKLCPRCQQWLTWKSLRHPLIMVLLHVVPLMALWVALSFALSAHLDSLQNPGPYYSEFPDSLRVLESRMNWVQTPEGARIYVTGVLTNTSPVGWGQGEFDCRFYDARGAMIDAFTGRGHISAYPRGESAFRVMIVPTAPTNDYASVKVFVGDARNAKGLF